jgi:RNA polymerase primary sigma factor
MQAVRRFDPSRQVRLITYAVWWIRQMIVHALSGQSRVFSLPVKLSPVAARFRDEVAALGAALDHAPSAQEIADGLDISEAEADALMRIAGVDISLSAPIGTDRDGERREVGDALAERGGPAVEETLIRQAVSRELRRAVAELDPKESEVVRLRFGLDGADPLTLQEVGARLGVSRERVRQIEVRAKEKLRQSQKAQALRTCLN